jgi:uncharacterized membrane protein
MELTDRFWEIDSLRGFAVTMMVAYHFLYDLNFFGVYDFNVNSGFLWYFARVTAFIFIFLVGLSLKLSYFRVEMDSSYGERQIFMKYLKRGFKLFSVGLLITLATWIVIREDFIVFGVLHFIGTAIILEALFLKRGCIHLFSGLLFVASGLYLQQFAFNFSGLLWLGFIPQGFNTVDYFPILPWLGVVSLGIFSGGILYKNYRRRFELPDLSKLYTTRLTCFLGRNSLLIYVVHQPVLIILLYFLGVLDLGFLYP